MALQQDREDTALLANTIETLSLLCRLPENAVAFATNEGVSCVLKLVETHAQNNSKLLQNSVTCLGIVARSKENAEYLPSDGKYIMTFAVVY